MYVIKDKCSVTSDNFFKKINQEKAVSHRNQSLYANNPSKDPLTKLNKTNSQLNLLKNQSPKLSVGVMRHKDRNENWSLLDVNFKKISEGLKMPKQYEKDNSDLYFTKSFNNANVKNKKNYFNYLTTLNKKSNNNNGDKNESAKNRNENEVDNLFDANKGENNYYSSYGQEFKSSRNKDSDIINIEHKDSYKEKDLFRKTSSTAFKKLDNFGLEFFKVNSKTNNPVKLNSDSYNPNKNSNPIINQNKSKEASETKSLLASLKSHGLEYKRLLNNSHNERAFNPHLIPNPKLISKEMLKSDIFFLKDFSFRENNKINNNFEKFNSNLTESNHPAQDNFLNKTAYNFNSNKYQESDIFLLKNNENSIGKIGEKHLLRETNSVESVKSKFNITSRSNSEWAPKNKIISLINHESTNYDFFNAQIKKKFYTKADIISMAKGSNPNKIQKCISEIIDLTRVGVPNANAEYLKAYENDNTIFRKRGNIGESFFNLHQEYKNICDKPFAKKLI